MFSSASAGSVGLDWEEIYCNFQGNYGPAEPNTAMKSNVQ